MFYGKFSQQLWFPKMPSRPLRVLRLIPVLNFGGVESRFTMLADEWKRDDIELEFCTFWKAGTAAENIRRAGGVVHDLQTSPSIRNPKATLALLNLLRRGNFDVVHSSIGEANFHAMLCARLGSWRTIIEETGLPNRSIRNRLIHAALYRLPDKIVSVSSASGRYLIEREWAPRNKLEIINNPSRREFFDAPRDHRYSPELIRFRTIGRLEPVKNLFMLLEAFAQARLTCPNIILDIYGSGSLELALANHIQALGASEFIQMHGFSSDVLKVHDETDWMLIPSISEGFSVAVCEALARGIPVIGSDTGGTPEILGPLGSDLLLPIDDVARWAKRIVAASRLSEREYIKLQVRVLRHAERFHPDHYLARIEGLYLQNTAKNAKTA